MLEIYNIEKIIANALEEDIGTGDITTNSTVEDHIISSGAFIAKEKGVICGLEVVKRVFNQIDPTVELSFLFKDGDIVNVGDVIANIKGKASSILTGERVALNFLQRMSGIATKTRYFSDLIAGTKAIIIDTRKTTPGLRPVEKYAVRIGGGGNHRYNLSDGVLIKDNHIHASGSIQSAVSRCRKQVSHLHKIEVETENIKQIDEAIKAGADVIMLDNMNITQMKEAVSFIDGRALVEASGNMDKLDIRSVANTGVDFISVGALTHSVNSLDISLKFK